MARDLEFEEEKRQTEICRNELIRLLSTAAYSTRKDLVKNAQEAIDNIRLSIMESILKKLDN